MVFGVAVVAVDYTSLRHAGHDRVHGVRLHDSFFHDVRSYGVCSHDVHVGGFCVQGVR